LSNESNGFIRVPRELLFALVGAAVTAAGVGGFGHLQPEKPGETLRIEQLQASVDESARKLQTMSNDLKHTRNELGEVKRELKDVRQNLNILRCLSLDSETENCRDMLWKRG